MKTMLLTGHKRQEIGLWGEKHPAFPYLKIAYQRKIIQAIEEVSVEWFLNSGTQGLELYSASWLLELKKDYPQIKLAMLLPYFAQEKHWKEDVQALYQEVLGRADFVDYITKKEYSHPWQLSTRNAYLIQKSDGLNTFFNGAERTHPWFFIEEGRKRQEKDEYLLWIMDSDDMQFLVEELNSNY